MRYVVLVCGKMRSGKDQFAKYVEEEFKNAGKAVVFDKFAQDLKDGCAHDFKDMATVINSRIDNIKAMLMNFTSMHFTDSGSRGILDEMFKNLDALAIQPHNWYEDKTAITRSILQIYGTEIFRDRVKESYWVDKVYDRVTSSESDVTLVTDTRFPNEIEVFSKEFLGHNDLGAVSVRVSRGTGIIDEHPSETALDSYDCFSYEIDNNGSLDDLRAAAKAFVEDVLHESS